MVEVMDDADSCSSRASVAWPAAAMNLKRRQKVEVFHDVVRRLRESECEEASLPGFEDELWTHFNRLPVRYALDVNVERAEGVLMHKRLLHMAHDPTTRPAYDVRLVQVPPIADENDGDAVHANVTRRDAHDSDYLGRQSVHPPPFGLSAGFELALEANKSHVKEGSSDMSANQHLFR